MADPTSVQRKVTDAVTQANASVLGPASAHALAMTYQAMAQSVALSMQNAVAAQQEMRLLSQAMIAQAVQSIMSIDVRTTAREAQPGLPGPHLLGQLTELLSTLTKAQQADTTLDNP